MAFDPMHSPRAPDMVPARPKPPPEPQYETRAEVQALRERIRRVTSNSLREHRDTWRDIRDEITRRLPYGT